MEKIPGHSRRFEWLSVLLLFCLSAGVALSRLQERRLPGGDEGSWMVPAAQMIQGRGFTTNWLIKQDLKPYAVPRPDDLRFPALVYLLAGAFLLFGTSYQTALGVMLALHLIFLFSVYGVCRKFFNTPTAILTLCLTGFSLLQLGWNTYVLTESLFGIVTAALILWSISLSPNRWPWWAGCGALIGFLALVKLHGILFLPGLGVLWLLRRKKENIPATHLLLGVSMALLALCPWLIRNTVIFGHPLHSAQAAWIFRYTLSDPTDLTFWQFVEAHGPWVFFKKLYFGIQTLFYTWDLYDYRMARFPILLLVLGLAHRRAFFNSFVLSGFALLFLGSAYTCYPFWIGIRFWSPLIPFVVGYGIFQGLGLADAIPGKKRMIIISLLTLLMMRPSLRAHWDYFKQERHRAGVPQSQIASYIQNLKTHVQPDEVYLAASMGQLSFLTDRLCVNIQDKYHMEEWVPRMLSTFNPTRLVLSHGELEDSTVAAAVKEIQRHGYEMDTLETDSLAVFYGLSPKSFLSLERL